MMQPLTEDCREDIQKKVDADPTVAVARNAVTAVSVNKVALDRNKVLALDPTVEVKLDSLKVTDQKTSGRCWMFAALNMYRQKIATRLNLEQFEFSEAYLQYFDKLEKAYFALNFLLGNEEPHAPHTEDGAVDLSDRRTAFVLDGGPRGQLRRQRAVGPDHAPPRRAGARFGHRPAGVPRTADPQQAGHPPVADGASGRDQTGERLEPLAEGERSVVAVAGAGEHRVIGHDPILSCPPLRVA